MNPSTSTVMGRSRRRSMPPVISMICFTLSTSCPPEGLDHLPHPLDGSEQDQVGGPVVLLVGAVGQADGSGNSEPLDGADQVVERAVDVVGQQLVDLRLLSRGEVRHGAPACGGWRAGPPCVPVRRRAGT